MSEKHHETKRHPHAHAEHLHAREEAPAAPNESRDGDFGGHWNDLDYQPPGSFPLKEAVAFANEARKVISGNTGADKVKAAHCGLVLADFGVGQLPDPATSGGPITFGASRPMSYDECLGCCDDLAAFDNKGDGFKAFDWQKYLVAIIALLAKIMAP